MRQYMRLDSAPPAISRVLFRWSHCSWQRNVLHNQPAGPPVRVCVDLSRERGEAAEEARTANKAQSPLKTLYNGLHQKGGNEYYIYSSFCFIEIKTLNHRKRDSTSHINIIVREINN
jgi:hypothetical protein